MSALICFTNFISSYFLCHRKHLHHYNMNKGDNKGLTLVIFLFLELKEEKDDLVTEIHSLRRLRTDSFIRRENEELRSEIEVLHEERHQLKAIIREMESNQMENNSQDGGSEITDVNLNALTLKSVDTINSNIKFETKPEYV